MSRRAWFGVVAVSAVGAIGLIVAAQHAGVFHTLMASTDRLQATTDVVGFAQGLEKGACARHDYPLSTGTISLAEFSGASDVCPAEVAVFGIDRQAELLVPPWSTGADDVQTQTGTPRSVDVVTRVAELPLADPAESIAARQRAEADLTRANHLYNTMRCGLAISGTVQMIDVQHAGTVLYMGCDKAGDIRTAMGHTPGKLNVYYIVGSNGNKGEYCGGDTMIVDSGSDNETLAHEIGHAFSLEHFPLATDNIMVSGTSVRNLFTLGQCFRCDFNPTSQETPVTPVAQGGCPATLQDSRCPAVWWPDSGTGSETPPPPPPPDQSPAAVVRAWLECEECTSAELSPVVKLGDVAVAMFRQAIDTPSNLNAVQAHLDATYAALRSYRDARPALALTFSAAQYRAAYLDNLRARYQLRAAIASAQINTNAARLLVRNLSVNARRDVRQYISARR